MCVCLYSGWSSSSCMTQSCNALAGSSQPSFLPSEVQASIGASMQQCLAVVLASFLHAFIRLDCVIMSSVP